MAQALKTIYFYNKSCNLRCRHCWIEPAFHEAVRDELTLDQVKNLLLQGKELGLEGVKLLGGEPLLLPYIRELIDFLIREKIRIMIETNGTLIDDSIASQLKGTNPFVSISLDGSDRKTHAILRGSPESFDKAVRGIRQLVRNGIHPQIIFCLHTGNRDDLENVVAFARQIGGSSLKVNFISSVGRARGIASERLTAAEFIRIYKSCEGKDYDGFKVQFDIPPAFQSVTCLTKTGESGTCGIKEILGVLSNGDISICGIGNVKRELLLGNARTDTLESIWRRNEILQTIRKNVPEGLGGICARCIFKMSCMGRCIAHTFYETGSLFSGDRFCTEAYELGLFPESRLLQAEKAWEKN